MTSSITLAKPADIIFIKGNIWTGTNQNVEAVAIAGKDIIYAGSQKNIEEYKNEKTRIIDLTGKMLMPGFHDTHVHPENLGMRSFQCDVAGLSTSDKILNRIKECDANLPEKEWLIGTGWSLSAFPNAQPSKILLDDILNDRPAWLIAEDGHNAWVNSKALEISGITKDTPNPKNGWIIKDEQGEVQGTLKEYAAFLMDDFKPQYDLLDRAIAFRSFMDLAVRKGITSIVDAWGTDDIINYYRFMEDNNLLKTKINVAYYIDPTWNEDWEKLKKRYNNDSEWLKVNQIKLWLDGVAEAQTAAISFSYKTKDGHDLGKGELFYGDEQIKSWIPKMEAMGYQVHMHTIGDRAVKQALMGLEESRKVNNKENNKPYLIHNYWIDEEDFSRIKQADASVNFTMLWRQMDPTMTELNQPFLTQDQFTAIMPMNEAHNYGLRVIGGSDAPVGQMNPLASIQVAVTRGAVPYFEGGDYNPDQPKFPAPAVDLETMLKAYTINAAIASKNDKLTGSIEKGKRADLIVLNHDLFSINPEDIYNTNVVMTIVNGKIVFEK